MSSGPQKQDEDAGQAGKADRMRRPECLLRHLVLPLLACIFGTFRCAAFPRVTFTRNIDDVGKDEILGGFLDCAVAAVARGGATTSICACLGSGVRGEETLPG